MQQKKSYHHGNLRAMLIQAGLELIEEKGVRALTLREIGARVEVSRTAAYRHFTDKDALLAAIYEAGFAQFADALDLARKSAPKRFAARLTAMALAYVRFAAEHPAHYEAMFAWRGALEDVSTPRKSESGMRAFAILEKTISEGQQSGDVRTGDTTMLARMVWAQVHGISTLRLEPDLKATGAGTRFVRFCSEVILAGLSPSR